MPSINFYVTKWNNDKPRKSCKRKNNFIFFLFLASKNKKKNYKITIERARWIRVKTIFYIHTYVCIPSLCIVRMCNIFSSFLLHYFSLFFSQSRLLQRSYLRSLVFIYSVFQTRFFILVTRSNLLCVTLPYLESEFL